MRTDEWGWGTSFHFSPLLPGKTVAASEAAHEARIGALLGLGPGKKALDAGCGVGGPMRTIASCTGAHVVGLTINDYQVERATYHNRKVLLRWCLFLSHIACAAAHIPHYSSTAQPGPVVQRGAG